jgi:hypothetical protein
MSAPRVSRPGAGDAQAKQGALQRAGRIAFAPGRLVWLGHQGSQPGWLRVLSVAPPVGVVNGLVEGVGEEAGDQFRLLVRDEVAGARDGD